MVVECVRLFERLTPPSLFRRLCARSRPLCRVKGGGMGEQLEREVGGAIVVDVRRRSSNTRGFLAGH